MEAALIAIGRWLAREGYRFTTITPESHRHVIARRHRAETVRDVFGWSLPFAPTLLPAGICDALTGFVELRADGLLESRVRFSTLGEQLFAHSAFPTTSEHAVFFGPDTYRFCAALRDHVGSARRAIDLGAGTGAGGISIADRCERVVLSDCNPEAAMFARVNAELAGCADRVEVVTGALFDAVTGDFDLVIANPPYLADAARRAYRDGGGELGTGIALRMIEACLQRLSGRLVLYTGSPIRDGVDPIRKAAAELLGARKWTYRELDPDVFGEELATEAYAQVERIAAVVLVAEI